MSRVIKKLGATVLVWFFEACVAIVHAARFVLPRAAKLLQYPGRIMLRYLVIPMYRQYRRMRRGIRNRAPEWLRGATGVFDRVLFYAVVSIVALGTTASSIYASGPRGGVPEQGSLLATFFAKNGGDVVEFGTPLPPVSQGMLAAAAVAAEPLGGNDGEGDFYEDDETAMILQDGAIFAQPLPTGENRRTAETYVVAAGDTIAGIAQRFGVSIDTILWANKLTVRSIIRPGNTLTIPPISGVLHKVARGETVRGIAQRYRVNPDDVVAWNQLADASDLRPGETLVIPGGRMPAPPAPPKSSRTVLIPSRVTPNASGLIWPSACHRITQGFSWRHTGIDIACGKGHPLRAVADGIVMIAGWNRGGYGYQVVIDHGDGRRTRYAHASQLNAKVGDQVRQGDVVALEGTTGRSTGPHNHFELYIDGRRVNPLQYIR